MKREVKYAEDENPDQACHVVGYICPSPSTSSSSTGPLRPNRDKYVRERERGRGEVR